MITALNPAHEVRQAVLAALKADYDLTLLVPAARIYPQQSPAKIEWNFIRLGAMIATPYRVQCSDGSTVAGIAHCFTKAQTGSPDPEQAASLLNAHMARILDAIDGLDLGGAELSIHVTQAQVIQDSAEASAFHGFVSFDGVVL